MRIYAYLASDWWKWMINNIQIKRAQTFTDVYFLSRPWCVALGEAWNNETKAVQNFSKSLDPDGDPEHHYGDVIMGAMASQITGVWAVCPTVCSSADQRKHQNSASLAFVKGIHLSLVNSPHRGQVTRKLSPFVDVIMPWQFNQLFLISVKPFLTISPYSIDAFYVCQIVNRKIDGRADRQRDRRTERRAASFDGGSCF